MGEAGNTIQCQGVPSHPESCAPAEAPPAQATGGTPLQCTAQASRQRIEREELISDVMRLRWLSKIGAVAWFLFIFQDLIVTHYVGQGRLSVFLSVRAVGLVVILLVVHRLHSVKPLTRAQLTALDWGVFLMVDTLVAILCLEYGGIASRYVTGVLVALIARSSALAAPFRRGLLLLGVPVLAFPVTLGIAALFRADIAAQFQRSEDLATFAQSLYVLAASVVVCVWGGHGNWTMRRQLFESRSIGKYSLKHCIGRGGMGEVWVAYHAGLHRNVALKILHPEQDSDPIAVRRFEQEVAATTLLTHPNTVRVFDYGVTEDGIWYYAMELLEGVTLKELVTQQGVLEVPRALKIAHQIARALAEAHDHGIVHRDIKPENIFVINVGDERDLVKVLDFGIAKIAAAQGDVALTRTGAIFGTPAYMSPEAARGKTITPASDVYGVGGLLYFMLTGSPPFTSQSPTELLLAQAERSAPNVTTRAGYALDVKLELLVHRCLMKAPESRYADAGSLAHALGELRKTLG